MTGVQTCALPIYTPQTLLAVSVATGPFTSKVSVLEKRKKCLLLVTDGNILHYIQISNHYVVNLKLIQCYVNYTSKTQERIKSSLRHHHPARPPPLRVSRDSWWHPGKTGLSTAGHQVTVFRRGSLSIRTESWVRLMCKNGQKYWLTTLCKGNEHSVVR